MRSRLGILLDENSATAIGAGLIKAPEQTPNLNGNEGSQGSYSKALRDVWTPTASFLKPLKSEQLDEILAYINDKPVGSRFKNDKKANKVRLLDHMFNDEDKIKGYSIDKQTRIRTWLPDGLENKPDNVDWGDT